MKNQIYLRRRNKIFIESCNERIDNIAYVGTILKNIESLGYTLSTEIIKSMITYSVEQLGSFYFTLVMNLRAMVGANKTFDPMYPNFPQQTMNLAESELYLNAIIHYWSQGSLTPLYEKAERPALFDETKFKVITIGNEKDFITIFTNLMESKTSLSETDKNDLAWFFEEYKSEATNLLPNEIHLKENIAFITKLLLQNNTNEPVLEKYYKTATDVLRLAVSLSDGDISLAENTKFKSFKRSERRLLLSLLSNCDNIEEDMKRYSGPWIRLGERLHPSEFKTAYLKAQKAFNTIRNNLKIETFHGKVNKAINEGNYILTVELLKQRAGEFARKLDHLLRIFPDPIFVLSAFEDVAQDVSTTILLQVKEHFKQRNQANELRAFFPKGNVSKVYGIDNELPAIPKNICDSAVKVCENALISIFKEKQFLGKMYIEEKLKDYLIPFSQRSASKALKTIVRGSKIEIPIAANTIRAFIYWKEAIDDRVDIDLSAVMYDEKWNFVEHISYTNLRSNDYNACHSGDIVSAPDGASEFIDIDMSSVRNYGGRYIVLSMNSYTGQPFINIPECFMGWMYRDHPNSGEIYEPKTIQNKADITSNSKICIPIIIDLHDNKVIWTDIALASNLNHNNNVEGNKRGMVLMGKALTTLVKPNLYDLFELHQKARGIRCASKEEADVVFSVEAGVTPFDIDVIAAKYL